MYRCQQCLSNVPAGTRQRLVIETRPAVYPRRQDVYVMHADGKTWHEDDPGGTGREIAHAIRVCDRCADEDACARDSRR